MRYSHADVLAELIAAEVDGRIPAWLPNRREHYLGMQPDDAMNDLSRMLRFPELAQRNREWAYEQAYGGRPASRAAPRTEADLAYDVLYCEAAAILAHPRPVYPDPDSASHAPRGDEYEQLYGSY